MTRIYNVKFGSWTNLNVEAKNIGEAIRKAMKLRKGEYCNRIQDITEVNLIAEA